MTSRVFDQIERWALRRAARTVRFTWAGCEALVNHYGRAIEPNFTVFPAPVEVPPSQVIPRSPGPTRLLFVGRLVETKNVIFMFEVLAGLSHLNWTLDVLGDGEERARLEDFVNARDLSDRIRFRGHQEDVGSWYRVADLLVFPSRLESTGLVLLEAMSYGVPTLSIRSDGVRYFNANHEVVADGHDGHVTSDEGEFATRLAGLISAPEQLVEFGRNARLSVERRHRWNDHIDRYERLFDEILETTA